jgi:magnesium transporter
MRKRAKPPTSDEVAHLHWSRGTAGPPGTLDVVSDERPTMAVIDFCATNVFEHAIERVDEVVRYLEDDKPSITWLDVRGIGDLATFQRLGEIFGIHPLALEDVVNVPQRPKSEVFEGPQHLLVTRMVQLSREGNRVTTEQLGVLFGRGFLVTVQEEPTTDVLDAVRQRIRAGRGTIRQAGSDYLAYAILDAVIDGFYPVLETMGDQLDAIEEDILKGKRRQGRRIFTVKRELLTLRRAIWPQREMLAALIREEGNVLVSPETRVYLRDTYDHAVQVMDMVETYREIAASLMDLYVSGVSQRMNEVMKVLTIMSSIFLPLTFIAGLYGMNFDPDASPFNMPELRSRFGYPLTLLVMVVSVGGLLVFYRRKGWLDRDE